MMWFDIRAFLTIIQHVVSIAGILVILTGVVIALYRYCYYLFSSQRLKKEAKINDIRLHLGRTLILGLEFIVAGDLIGTTTTPDYYSVGILAIIVAIRTLLSYSINKELLSISRER